MNMKRFICALATGLSFTASMIAGSLHKEAVSADAKWLVHLDLDAFRKSQLGEFVGKQILDPKLAKPKADLKEQANFDFDWRRVTSLTAYGTEFQPRPRGVLLLTTDLNVRAALDVVIGKQALGGAQGPIKRLESAPVPLYAYNDDLFVVFQPGKPIVISKSRDEALKARAVLAGESPNLLASLAFTEFPPPPKAFFFLTAAEGFNDVAPIPASAKVLKMADSLRLVLGESGDQVFVNLALKAKTPEVSQQIQQVIQGMLALLALSQVDNPDLNQLVQTTKVTVSDKMVVVDLHFPVAKTVQKIEEDERVKVNRGGGGSPPSPPSASSDGGAKAK